MFKNYIFDFGQVIVRFDPYYMTSVYVNKPEQIKVIASVVFDRLYFDKLDAGTITDEEVRHEICGRLPKELHNKACLVYDNWYYNLPIMNGMPELLKDIKDTGGSLFLLSNISRRFADYYNNVPQIKKLFKMFDGLVFSGKIGLIKPNKDIYEYLLNAYNLKNEESIFIDDNEKNVLMAESLGIKSIIFDGDTKKLRSSLLPLNNS